MFMTFTCTQNYEKWKINHSWMYSFLSSIAISGQKQWQTTPKNLPRMQCARAIPVTWLGSASCQARPSRLNTNEWIAIRRPSLLWYVTQCRWAACNLVLWNSLLVLSSSDPYRWGREAVLQHQQQDVTLCQATLYKSGESLNYITAEIWNLAFQ